MGKVRLQSENDYNFSALILPVNGMNQTKPNFFNSYESDCVQCGTREVFHVDR